MNLPDYHFLPAPFSLVTLLHLVTFALHLLAMNFLLGGVMIVLWGKFSDRWNDPIVKKLIVLFPTVMAATVTLGVAPLLFLQLVFPQQAYPAAIVSGWFWLIIIPVVICAYYLLYNLAFSEKATSFRKGLLLSLALLGLLYVSYIYSSVFSMAERPDYIKELYATNQSGFLINPDITDYIFRWLHMVFGAIAVGGFFVGVLGRKHEQAYQVGKNVFLVGVVFAAIFGVIYLFALADFLKPLMNSPAIYVLAAAIILTVISLHFFFKKKFVVSGLLVFLSLLGMATTRHYVRLLRLEGVFDPAATKVAPQWSVFILFLIFFVLAIGLVGYMLHLYFSSREDVST